MDNREVILGVSRPGPGTSTNGFQPNRPTSDGGGAQGGYQGPTGQGAPANPPSGGSSGGRE